MVIQTPNTLMDAIQVIAKAIKPPRGYTPIPNSKHGGFHKRVNGVWKTWYGLHQERPHPTERFTHDEHEHNHAKHQASLPPAKRKPAYRDDQGVGQAATDVVRPDDVQPVAPEPVVPGPVVTLAPAEVVAPQESEPEPEPESVTPPEGVASPPDRKEVVALDMSRRGLVLHRAMNRDGVMTSYWVRPETVALVEERGGKWEEATGAGDTKDPFKRWSMKGFEGLPYPYEVPRAALTPADAFAYAEAQVGSACVWEKGEDGVWRRPPKPEEPEQPSFPWAYHLTDEQKAAKEEWSRKHREWAQLIASDRFYWRFESMNALRMGERTKTGQVFSGRTTSGWPLQGHGKAGPYDDRSHWRSGPTWEQLHARGWIYVPGGIDPNTETRSHAEIIQAEFDAAKNREEARLAEIKRADEERLARIARAREDAYETYRSPEGAPEPSNAVHPRMIADLADSRYQLWTWDERRNMFRKAEKWPDTGSWLQRESSPGQYEWQKVLAERPNSIFVKADEIPNYERPVEVVQGVKLGVSVERPPDFMILNFDNIETRKTQNGRFENWVPTGNEEWLHEHGFWKALDREKGHQGFLASILIDKAKRGETYEDTRSEKVRSYIASAARNLAAWWSDINDDDREYFWEHFCDKARQPTVVRPNDPRHENADFAIPPGMEKFRDKGWNFHEYQRKAINFAADHAPRALWAEEMGLGKGGVITEKILTPSGWVRYGDIRVGDRAIGSDGLPTRVTGVYRRGVLPVYRVTFNDRTSVTVDGDHLWAVRSNNDQFRGKGFRVMETRSLASDLAIANGNLKWRIPLVQPIHFDDGEALQVDPYLLGVLLGDGGLTQSGVGFCCGDEDTPIEVAKVLPPGTSLNRVNDNTGATERWTIAGVTGGSNPLLDSLRELGMMGHAAPTKRIPRQYMFATPDQRLSLLQGLMDTDGEVRESDGWMGYSSASKGLVEDIAFVVQSLGGVARYSVKEKTKYIHNGEVRYGLPSHKLTISLPPHLRGVRSLPRWAAKAKYLPNRVIKSIEPAGYEEVVCIAVDAPDRLYVTEHCIVTHNTIQAIGLYHHLKARGEVKQMIITAPTSAIGAWEDEFKDNSNARVRVVAEATAAQRDKAYADFRDGKFDVLVMTPYVLGMPDPGDEVKPPKAAWANAPEGAVVWTKVDNGKYRPPTLSMWTRKGNAWESTEDWGNEKTTVPLDKLLENKPYIQFNGSAGQEWAVAHLDAIKLRKIIEPNAKSILRVADEVHLFKNADAARRRGFEHAICQPEGRVVGMSGTPKPNGPEDFYTIVNDITRGALGSSLDEFSDRYCYASSEEYGAKKTGQPAIMGFRPGALSELYRDNAGFLFARTTQDPDAVLQLKPQIHIAPRLKPDETQIGLQASLVKAMILLHQALADEAAARAAQNRGEMVSDYSPSREMLNAMADGSFGPLEQLAARKVPWDERSLLIRLKQASIDPAILDDGNSVTGPGGPLAGYESPKMQAVADAAVTHISQNEETGGVLFSTSVGGLYAMKTALMKRGIKAEEIGIIHGGIARKAREEIRRDLNSGKLKFVIGQTKALNTGANMQARANFVAHIDTPWEPDVLTQSTARVHRQGQKRKVTVLRPVGSDVDALIERRVAGKLRANANALGRMMESDRVALESMVGRGLSEADFSDELSKTLGVSAEVLRPQGERVMTGMRDIIASLEKRGGGKVDVDLEGET